MKARTVIALLFFLVGLGVVLYGITAALMELTGLYSNALNSPLDTPPGGEKGVSDRMIRAIIIGACGLPPLLIGSAMMGMGVVAWIVKLAGGRSGKQPPSAAPPQKQQDPARTGSRVSSR